ncbi:MAG TPA: zinc ribbon domain-containing protein [Longimicrobiales bacterium]|nr:zinc ribbon domain-containing protein [Longimicrobiales bacterium]
MPTDPRSGAAVGRLYEALAEALAKRGGPPAADVTVSEIYQTLVPYAHARAELGFEMNADYEHALMRLIAGEGGYATLEQPEARAQVARELESQNPDVTLYRRFAASTVRLSPSPTPRAPDVVSGGASPSPEAGSQSAPRYVSLTNSPAWNRPAPAPAAPTPDATLGAVAADPTEPAPRRRDSTGVARGEALDGAADGEASEIELLERSERALDRGLAHLSTLLDEDAGAGDEGTDAAADGDAREAATPASRPADCGSCGRALPTDREARFCPYCGSEQPTVCAACGDDMAPDWRYCPACGAEA